jgi:NAD(P) transhydrogenase subunit beta
VIGMTTLHALVYLVTTILFVYGVMRLRQPATARSGNTSAAVGMLLALVVTFIGLNVRDPWLMIGGIVVGAAIGAISARLVPMTAMPQMVALFNGMGGGAAALVAVGDVLRLVPGSGTGAGDLTVALVDILIGGVSFSGSIIAFLKLNEWMTGRPITYAGQRAVNLALFALLVLGGAYLVVVGESGHLGYFLGYVAAAVLLGLLGVFPIGGGDMPVVISLLNSFTGLAVAATGFLLGNNVLIVAGTFVGASGAILTQLMSRAMNRPLGNIIFGAFGQLQTTVGPEAQGTVQQTSPEDVAIMLSYASHVVIVPGYGLAVARAQQEVKELMDRLEAKGVDVKFGIHPVAGRMPGHMNVLLAEVDIPYQKLYDLDAINPEFPRTDVVLVVGANDVTNPDARNNPNSPIYGMPILNVDQAQRIVVLKRSMNPGFAGIDNPLYFNPKCQMLFGDARKSLSEILKALQEGAA